jgi:PncC family amidohydrolase
MSYLETLVNVLTGGEFTVATAESCTGGALGAVLTSVSGSSAYYPGGVIVYANSAKMQLLGVGTDLLKEYGAVSRECAEAMALGCRRVFASTFAVSVTGIAGPTGGSADRPVGTVYIAVDGPAGVSVSKHFFSGDRAGIRQQTVDEALKQLVAYIRGNGRTDA